METIPSPVGVSDSPGGCVQCGYSLTERSSDGTCLRCLATFLLSTEDDSLAELNPQDREDAGRSILLYGQFEIERGADGFPVELGHGSMGTTYRAQDTVLHTAVALKVINPGAAAHPAAQTRFLREARAAAALRHPNVASVFHYGEQNGACYYAMELVEGETLEERVRRDGPLPPALALEIAAQVASALAAAEAGGIVHRDLKPSNLMLSARQGEGGEVGVPLVKVIDFGLAKVVSAMHLDGKAAADTRGGFVGTPAFASPEQFARDQDGRIDTRSDIYSLGVTLWYLLGGKTPFVGSTLSGIEEKQRNGPLPWHQLAAARAPRRIVTLLKSMLAVDPAQRPQSARELLELVRRCQDQTPLAPRAIRFAKRVRRTWLAAALLGLLAVAALIATMQWRRDQGGPGVSPDRSVAVLLFENLSLDKAEAFFTAGVQSEIISGLARIADLKVIGPESARTYLPGNRDLNQISGELGVRHLVEGSVQREGDQVRVAVKLTDVRDAAHRWTKQYEGNLAGIFGIQGEITRELAARLNASVSPLERAAIDAPPTKDHMAYDLYLRALDGPKLVSDEAAVRQEAERRIALLDAAVTRDPGFVLAYCELARQHGSIVGYRFGVTTEERSVDHRTLAEVALQKARRLQPDAGEVHLAQAQYFFHVGKDPEQARIEADLARRLLPNNAESEALAGRVARLEGRWEDAVRLLERAVTLEPRDNGILIVLARTYEHLRRYADFDRALARISASASAPLKASLNFIRTTIPIQASADLAPLRAALARLPPIDDPKDDGADRYRLLLALCEHDADGVSRVLAKSEQTRFLIVGFAYPKAWFEALAARMRGDAAGAATAFTAARLEVEKSVLADASDGRALVLLAMIDAGLGRREEAVREARRACEIMPLSKQATTAPTIRCGLAAVYTWTEQPDLAISELEELVKLPAGNNMLNQPTYGDLRLNPIWEPLRKDPRFEALLQRLALPPTR